MEARSLALGRSCSRCTPHATDETVGVCAHTPALDTPSCFFAERLRSGSPSCPAAMFSYTSSTQISVANPRSQSRSARLDFKTHTQKYTPHADGHGFIRGFYHIYEYCVVSRTVCCAAKPTFSLPLHSHAPWTAPRFAQYDYIGAPWREDLCAKHLWKGETTKWVCVGNSGLAMYKLKTIIEVLSMDKKVRRVQRPILAEAISVSIR